jgi:hypothetical protein
MDLSPAYVSLAGLCWQVCDVGQTLRLRLKSWVCLLSVSWMFAEAQGLLRMRAAVRPVAESLPGHDGQEFC